jgi:eukaryotic-like serine/threonine-protein kinase
MPRIGQYQFAELLGEGGIGRVHAAYDIALKREVAVKSLRPELLRDAGFVERFRAEAANLARLDHPNITTVYSLLEQGRSLFMVMERVRGQTVEELLRERKRALGMAETLAVVMQVAEGLSYAHSMGLIHRDIKPANIMVIPSSGRVKIMDFGIALLRGAQRLTRDGRTIGTAAYMSPEQARGEPTDERSDLYSLGIVLHEMLTGSLPFNAETEYGLMQAHVSAKPPRLRSVMPDADSRLENALSRVLAKRPEQRYPSMSEFRDALAACVGGRNVVAKIPSKPADSSTKRSLFVGLPSGPAIPAAVAAAIAAGLMIWVAIALPGTTPTRVWSKGGTEESIKPAFSGGMKLETPKAVEMSRPETLPHRSVMALPPDDSSVIRRAPELYPASGK